MLNLKISNLYIEELKLLQISFSIFQVIATLAEFCLKFLRLFHLDFVNISTEYYKK